MSSSVEVSAYNFLKQWRGKSFLLAISGGRDSMALLKLFESLAPKLQLTLSVANIHHGPSQEPQQSEYRDQCFEYLKKHCEANKILFYSNISSCSEARALPVLKSSEAEHRRYRKSYLKDFCEQSGVDFLVFAHHKEDLFETRLIRMLRGTGPQGLVAMSPQSGRVLRPFLQTSREDLKNYLGDNKFFEDPSNLSTHYLRNWLRREWLPRLEKRRPGSVECLQQSLELCLEALEQVPSLQACFDQNQRVLRSEYTGLSSSEKKRLWAQYLKQVGVENYGLSHINELVKRLDVEQKDLTFILLKKRWLANARHIWCESKNTLE